MISPSKPKRAELPGFRVRLLVAMMLVVSAVTILGLLFAQHRAAADVKRGLQLEFQSELDAWHAIQDVRYAALAERCHALARKPRLHAALEDDALDLLYLSARDELSDIMEPEGSPVETGGRVLRARFYRFLDARGRVISPPEGEEVGRLAPGDEARLAFNAVPDHAQTGYLVRNPDRADETIDEIMVMPIFSTETGEAIAALLLGFNPVELGGHRTVTAMRSGLWLQGHLHLPSLSAAARAAIEQDLARAVNASPPPENSMEVEVDGGPQLLFYKRLNPGSLFPPTYEVCLYPLTESLARQRRLLWQFGAAGAVLLLGAFFASNFLSSRLSAPVEKLAVDSAENRAQRRRAEAALQLTSEELQRSARFSADASHQLKTPVTVLRAGLEELLAGEKLPPAAREEISTLVHQTLRLTNVIEDLLLLSRMDAGRLQLEFSPVDLIPLIEGWLDDFSVLPDALGLKIETDLPPALAINGEKRYTSLILQNLLENARKYNCAGGRLRIAARPEGTQAVLTVGNTGRPIPRAMQEHIFERFHRGSSGENIPGHGLGLNLGRELARLHRGDLKLTRSDEAWTEFEVRFQLAPTNPAPSSHGLV
ncbi:MAG TPA: HAMP domain-containing sensor histidine kinase [Opitutaceae bacterium]|nr:HAMP domain-containing sensor histidine kinase [Opitutaceae bacterium]